MSEIAENIAHIKKGIPKNVSLIAVSKTKPTSAILEAYQCGQRIFGENKAQEMVTKFSALPKDIEWHMIGHLQTNKVKSIASFVSLIHGVDSLSLLKEINKQALKNNRIINVLLQFYIATEETKFGFTIASATAMFDKNEFHLLKNIRILGVMGMASFTYNEGLIRQEFQTLIIYFTSLKTIQFKNENSFKELSMGMSGDYKIAIEEGSTMVRVGSAIFGERH